jgi:hypothetical protein
MFSEHFSAHARLQNGFQCGAAVAVAQLFRCRLRFAIHTGAPGACVPLPRVSAYSKLCHLGSLKNLRSIEFVPMLCVLELSIQKRDGLKAKIVSSVSLRVVDIELSIRGRLRTIELINHPLLKSRQIDGPLGRPNSCKQCSYLSRLILRHLDLNEPICGVLMPGVLSPPRNKTPSHSKRSFVRDCKFEYDQRIAVQMVHLGA